MGGRIATLCSLGTMFAPHVLYLRQPRSQAYRLFSSVSLGTRLYIRRLHLNTTRSQTSVCSSAQYIRFRTMAELPLSKCEH